MHVDAITLASVASEWRTLLTGARIDNIIQPTAHAIALQCYAPAIQGEGGQGGQNYWLYISAHPQLARAHLTALKPRVSWPAGCRRIVSSRNRDHYRCTHPFCSQNGKNRERKIRIALSLFFCWLRPSWQRTIRPVGMCKICTAESVVFTP